MKILHTLKHQFRTPLVILIHIASWIMFYILFEATVYKSVYKILDSLKDEIAVLLVLGFITSYRDTRGRLNGIANTQQEWMNWYHNQEDDIPNYHNILTQSLPEKFRLSSVLISVKNIFLELFRKPMIYVFHFICWHFIFFLGSLLDDPMQFTIRERESIGIFQIIENIVSDMSHEYIYGLVVIAIFAIITCIQDVKGILKGIALENRQWLNWYENQNDSLPKQNNLNDTPSLISNETGLIFVKREPVYTIVHIIIVMVIFFLIAIQLIQITEWSGIKFWSWAALLVLLLR